MSFGVNKPELIFALEGREVRIGQMWHRVEKVTLNGIEHICLVITKGLGFGSHSLVGYHIARLEIFLLNSREVEG